MSENEYYGMIGKSKAIHNVFKIIERVAVSDSTILINGETGTGKGMAARAIHQLSPRSEQPFVPINCGAIPENLLESELFGHVRGAFTGATTAKIGKFEQADSGTVFLDEIGDMSPDLQVKILRVLEEGEFEPVGGNKTIHVNIRVIAATHRDLEKRVEQGKFREDLYYRLYVIPLNIPALRERKSDIPELAVHFLNQINTKNHLMIAGFSSAALESLQQYDWPGNVRELRNLVERLVILKQEGIIDVEELPLKIAGRNDFTSLHPSIELTDEGLSLNTAVTEFEKALILQSLEKAQWVKNRAAKLLHLNRTTLVEKIKRYQISPPEAMCRV